MTEPAFTFLTWNLAMLARSAQAPVGWGQEHTEVEVRRVVLEAKPDLVLFQELPRLVPYIETHDMVKANPESHQGNLATLVSHELVRRVGEPEVRVVAGCAILTTFEASPMPITIANVHLAPGPGSTGASARLDQLAHIVEASPSPAIVIVGDTNTRVDELDVIGSAELDSPKPPRPTWNSRANRFHARGPRFEAYFTRAFTSPGVTVTDQRVWDRPVDSAGSRFFVSDHFGLSGSLRLVEAGQQGTPTSNQGVGK